MGIQTRKPIRRDCSKPTPEALLEEPLEFIHEDHLRERQICAFLDDIGDGTAELDVVQAALDFLSNELPLYMRDEEEDLFPLLKRRCEPDDEIEKIISKPVEDHEHANQDAETIVNILEKLVTASDPASEAEKLALQEFAAHTRKHLILENAIILPFARLRLTENDRKSLYLRMCQRRGLERLKEDQDAE